MANRRPQLSITRPQDTAPPTVSPFPLSTGVAPDQMQFSDEAEERLSQEEKDLARTFFTAWRRTGEFLLEAARWMSEARARVSHGNWALWLKEVKVSEDLSEQLRNVWDRAQLHAQFAEAIRMGKINTTTAYLLAPASVPDLLIDEVIAADEPLTTTELRRRLRGARTPTRTPRQVIDAPAIPTVAQIPNNSENDRPPVHPSAALVLLRDVEREQIRELTRLVLGYAEEPDTLAQEDWALLADLHRALGRLADRKANREP